jgi:hypothetical protein
MLRAKASPNRLHSVLFARTIGPCLATRRRAALALAAGAIQRAKGGIAMQAEVAPTVETLLAVARSSSAAVAPWVLHGLLLTANAAGLAYVSKVPVRGFRVWV